MSCWSCKHKEVINEYPCSGCSHGRNWEPQEDAETVQVGRQPKSNEAVAPCYSMHNTWSEYDETALNNALTQVFSTSTPPASVMQDTCGNCHKCLRDVMENGLPVTSQRMIFCPECHNKRCPKASDHNLKCTNSNDPGQKGSIY